MDEWSNLELFKSNRNLTLLKTMENDKITFIKMY